MPFLENDTPEPPQEPSLRDLMARFAPAPVVYKQPLIQEATPEKIKEKVQASIQRGNDGRATQVAVNGRLLKVVRDENGLFSGLQEID